MNFEYGVCTIQRIHSRPPHEPSSRFCTARNASVTGAPSTSTSNDEPVEGGEDPLRRLRIDYLRWEHHDSAARVGHRTNVDLWQKRCPHIPDAGLRLLEIARDADDRPYGLGR